MNGRGWRSGILIPEGKRERSRLIGWALLRVLAHGVVLAGSFAAARWVALGWSGGEGGAAAVLYRPLTAVTAAFLAAPWLLLAHRRGLSQRPRALVTGIVSHGAAGLAAWFLMRRSLAPTPLTAMGVLVGIVGVPVAVLAAVARRRAAALAGAALAMALLAAGWTALVRPLEWGRWRAWTAGGTEGYPTPAGVLVVLASLAAAVGYTATRWGRRPCVQVAAMLVLLMPLGWAGWAATLKGAPGREVLSWLEEAPAVAPRGVFASASGAGVLGWRWVRPRRDVLWRRALVVRPPCRLRGKIQVRPMEGDTPSTSPLEFFLALDDDGRKRTTSAGVGVRVRLEVVGEAGRPLARVERILKPGRSEAGRGLWEELRLPRETPGENEAEVLLYLEPVSPGEAGGKVPLVALAEPTRRPPPDDGPNCLVILVDALRSDVLSCYGFPRETSPDIDRLAREGVLFERAMSACSWTVPSVASLFTGTFVSTHGTAHFRMPGRLALPTLAEEFRLAGARTAAVSANRLVNPASGFGRGFDVFLACERFSGDQAPRADWVTDHALALLRRYADRRFFIYLHYMDPHSRYDPPPDWALFGQSPFQRYLGEVAYCDSEIGRLLAGLEEMGLAENTIVVFLADHGEAFLEHGFPGHGFSLHREEVQVPLILWYPGRLPAGVRVGALVRSVDLFPTLAELAGLDLPRRVEGESLVPLLAGDDPPPGRAAFAELYVTSKHPSAGSSWASIEEGPWKLILRLDTGRGWLYDVKRDPEEQFDLSGRLPNRAAAMGRRLRRFLAERGGPRTPARPLTPREEEQLRALGYLVSESDRSGKRRTPKKPPRRAPLQTR